MILLFMLLLLSTPIHAAELPTEVIEAMQDNERTEATQDEIEMLVCLVMAEAENQDILGKQLVVDVVLNRLRDERFPNTICEVIYSPGQFACSEYFMSKTPTQDCYDAVYSELEMRQDKEVLYFRTGKYGSKNALYKHGDHYFSK